MDQRSYLIDALKVLATLFKSSHFSFAPSLILVLSFDNSVWFISFAKTFQSLVLVILIVFQFRLQMKS